MSRKLRAAILGFGGIGHFHAACYRNQEDCQLVALADNCPAQLESDASEINIGGSGKTEMEGLHLYHSFESMLKNEELDFVDICVPTDLHAKYAVKALRAGLHVLSEKPMARTLAQADAMVRAADETGKKLMIAQCLRFHPAFDALKTAYDSRKYGRLLRLATRRIGGLPCGLNNWFQDGKRSGGALLDMHIHDIDFINYLLGVPDAVVTFGCTHHTGAIDDALTNYIYDGGPLVSSETSWSHGGKDGAEWVAGYSAIFEDATLFCKDQKNIVVLRADREKENIETEGDCYANEVAYFARCVRQDRMPQQCMPQSTRETLRIALAEERSALTGRKVRL